ncbi:MAG: hypothetical protein NC331_03015 [Lachnospiraceae bacterium]|nr:hypothetical protein [Lachnospiraceae bacterium]MCM1238338.1 hypothetical protein [Lachnospiraceae bacterium]
MGYEKPQILDMGMSEGVYAASGSVAACDCFEIQNIRETPNSGGRYWLYFEIVQDASRTHIAEENWNNIYVEITFAADLPATVKLDNGINGTISGNKVIVEKASVIPSDSGCSYEGVWISGEGATDLRYTSIVTKHHM